MDASVSAYMSHATSQIGAAMGVPACGTSESMVTSDSSTLVGGVVPGNALRTHTSHTSRAYSTVPGSTVRGYDRGNT